METKKKKRIVLKKQPKKQLRGKCPICKTTFKRKVHNQKLCGNVECKNKYKLLVKSKAYKGEVKCSCCRTFVPKEELSKKGVCKECKNNHEYKCKHCTTLFYSKKTSRVFCSLRCSALGNQEAATKASEGPKHNLQDILDDILPLIEIDTPIVEACEYMGRSASTVQNYLSGKRDLQKYPELREFRQQVRRARAFIKIAARKTLSKFVITTKDENTGKVTLGDVNTAKFIITNRDKRYQGGHNEDGGTGSGITVRFAAGKSPFIQPEDDLSGKKKKHDNFDD